MKANKILLSMMLPVALAACTSEEIVENASNDLQGRMVLPEISVSVDGGVDSRFSWNEGSFGWNNFTANDKFSAGLVDDVQWTAGDKVLTNYIYKDEAGNGAFTTTSKMVEGVYFFYSYPGFEDATSRQAISFDLTSQTSIDFANPTAAVEANQLFVSPLYKLDAATANGGLPIKFHSYWSTAALKIKNTSGESFKVVRVLFENGGNTSFELKGTLAPSDLATVNKDNSKIEGFCYSLDATEGYILGYADVDKKELGRVNHRSFLTYDFADATKAEKSMMLNAGKYELANGEEALAYFQVPAGVYEDLKVTIFVETPETEDMEAQVWQLPAIQVKKNAKSANATANDLTAFYRGETTALFGVENGAVATQEIDDLDIMAATAAGAYASNYEELSAVVKEFASPIEISNMGSLQINDKVIRLLNSTNKAVKFLNPIEMTTGQTGSVNIPTNVEVTDVKIVNGKFTASHDLKGTITVSEGTELTVKNAQTGTITNYGTVKVAVNGVTISNITSNGVASVVEVVGNVTIGTAANQVKLTSAPKTLKVTGSSTTAAVATFDNATGALTVPNLTVNAYGSVVDAAMNLDITTSVDNSGSILGTRMKGADDDHWALVDNKGNGYIEGMTLNKYSKITNTVNAELKSINKNGASDAGLIDNTAEGYVSACGSEIIVYVAYDGVNKTGKLGAVQGCNKVILKNATWTDATVYTTVKNIELDNVELTTTNSGSISLAAVDNVVIKNSKIKKAAAFTNALTINLAGTTIDAAVTGGAATAKVVSLKGVTVNANLTLTGSTTATTLDMSGVTVANSKTLTVPANVAKFTMGDAEETEYTTAVNGTIVANGLTAIEVLKGATLKIGIEGNITDASATPVVKDITHTGEGTVRNMNSNCKID